MAKIQTLKMISKDSEVAEQNEDNHPMIEFCKMYVNTNDATIRPRQLLED